MALNHAIYVFTAVTVVYTPLGFMAVCTGRLCPWLTSAITYPRVGSWMNTDNLLAGTLGAANLEYHTRR